MSRVEINARGRHVLVIHDGDLDAVTAAAVAVWDHTAEGHGVGFTLPAEVRCAARAAPVVNRTDKGAADG